MKNYHNLFTDHGDDNSGKEEIERIQSLLAKKLKDPEMAKKAAMIIEAMIHSVPTKKPKNKEAV